MGTSAKPADGAITLAELREFASFSSATQRYIRRSLDIGLHRRDAMKLWSRDMVEEASIRAQARIYGQDRLASFSSYRFLYERLLGAGARPWLPGAFCAAASLPHLHPEKRRILLQSISEAAATAAGWSNREPSFYPEWVEKVDLSKAN